MSAYCKYADIFVYKYGNGTTIRNVFIPGIESQNGTNETIYTYTSNISRSNL